MYIKRVYPDRFSIVQEAIENIDSFSLLGYHTPTYMNALTRVLDDNPLYIVAFHKKKIAGFLPLRWRKGRWGPVINGLPFFGPNGGPIVSNIEEDYLDAVMTKLGLAVREFSYEIEAISVACYTPFLSNAEVFEQAFSPDCVVDKFTQYIDLKSFKGWPTNIRRKSVNRAKNRGVTVRLGGVNDIPRLIEIFNEHHEQKGIPSKPDSYLYQVVEQLYPLGISRFTVAEYQGRVVACLITIQSKATVSANVLSCEQSALNTQANSLLVDESVRTLASQGYRFWNWESSPSKDHPVYKFKARWGSEEGNYKILVNFPRTPGVFSGITKQEIISEYPFYFVIPFNELDKLDDH